MSTCRKCNATLATEHPYCPHCGQAQGGRGDTHRLATVEAGSSLLTRTEQAGPAATSSHIDHGQFIPGTMLGGRYRIVGLIGKGGMGEVYRADDLKLGQSVALKFLPPDLARNEKRLERFLHEVRMARQISHANICRVYDIGEVSGLHYISMEYIDGENLSSLLLRIGRVPRDKGIEIARQLCAGLAAAHERGILHRDLKPMNVMIDGRGRVRITDFGLAALADEASGAELRAGTPAFMAPEQLAGREVSVRSDIFSLGLILYETFTGRRPFEARTEEELKRVYAESAPPRPSAFLDGFDAAVERVLLHCLEHEPAERPSSVLAVLAALPGGDPLAAALAAGETPSPELVAASAHAEGVPPSVCLACLLIILAGVVTFPWLSDQIKLHSHARLDKPPEVLVDRSRLILAEAGIRTSDVDHSYGFVVNNQVLDRIDEIDSPGRWMMAGAEGAAPMEFWYRQSPLQLVPGAASGRVTEHDPPPTQPGMVQLRLDPQGRLVSLSAIPDVVEGGPASTPFDWTTLLIQAGLSGARLERVTPRWVPPMHSDERAAWIGTTPSDRTRALRIEAASLKGRPVFFRVAPDWVVPGGSAEGPTDFAATARQVAGAAVFVASFVVAAILARRNLELNRGDRRGAWRVSLFVFSASMLAWLLRADHVSSATLELEMLIRVTGNTLLTSALCWLLYIALEPHLRRRWPDMLISWNRLLAGRWRDPLIGRDILIGGLFGIFGILLTAVRHFGPGWFGAAAPRPGVAAEMTLLGLRYDLANLLSILVTTLIQPMSLLILLLLFLVLLRRRWMAIVVFYAMVTSLMTIFAAQSATQSNTSAYFGLAYFGVLSAALIFVLLRFGLLALIVALFYVLILDGFPITAATTAWFAESSWFALGVLVALTIFGFVTALAGRSLLTRRYAAA